MLVSLLALASCAKETDASKQIFYGKIAVSVSRLQDTTQLEVRYQDKLLGDAPISYPGTPVEAGKTGELAVYIKGTTQKIADTTITINKNELSTYKIAYMPEMGLKGWLNTAPVGADSVGVVIVNNLTDFLAAHPSIDLYICYLDVATLQRVETGIVIPHFENVKQPVSIVLPYYYDKANDPYQSRFYYVKFKDNATGNYITYPPKNRDYFGLNTGEVGSVYLENLTSNAGVIGTSYTQL